MRLRNILSISALGLSLAMTPVFTTALRAADAPAKEAKQHKGFIERYQEAVGKLTLTAEEKTKIDAAFADATTKRDDIVKAAGEDKSGLHEKLAPVAKELKEKIDAALTAEQKADFDKAVEGHHKKPAAAAK